MAIPSGAGAAARPRADGTPPRDDPENLERLRGPRRTALRVPGHRTWALVDRDAGERMPLGLRVELERRVAGAPDTYDAQEGLPPWSRGMGIPRLPGALLAAVSAVLLLLGFIGLARAAPPDPALSASLAGVGSLALALLYLWTTFTALRWTEGAAVGGALEATVPWVRFRHGTLEVDPAAWRLGLPSGVAGASVLAGLALFVVGLGWRGVLAGPGVGVASGSVLYLVQALYPLRPGPGAALLGRAVGVEDLPERLRWALLTRFVPVPSRLRVEGGRGMAAAAAGFALWVMATGAALGFLARPAARGATLAGASWRLLLTLVLLAYAGWLLWRLVELVASALALKGARDLRPVEPSDEVRAEWERRNPLVRHVPELARAPWRWGRAPRGTSLTRFGEEGDRFLWLARGGASVIGRTPEGDPVLTAELQEGVGVGEVGLLGSGPRTADVVATDDSVVAVLDREDFDRLVQGPARDRFRDLVQASQALARSPVLWGLAAGERDAWLSAGVPHRHPAGTIVIAEGDDARWMGLVVRGRLTVSEKGAAVGELSPDDVLGEMAYLTGGRRRATVRAVEDVLLWRWDPAFLDAAVASGTLRDELVRLAENRS